MTPRIAIITGNPHTGKTSLCMEGLSWCKNHGIMSTGIISPGIYTGNIRIGITVHNVADGKNTLLGISQQIPEGNPEARSEAAKLRETLASPYLETPAYVFSSAAFDDCASWLRVSSKSVLWIDELGPLEFVRRSGFIKALDTIREGNYRAAIVVVRPSLVETFIKECKCPDSCIIGIEKSEAKHHFFAFLELLSH